jgi:hypothetical protein
MRVSCDLIVKQTARQGRAAEPTGHEMLPTRHGNNGGYIKLISLDTLHGVLKLAFIPKSQLLIIIFPLLLLSSTIII